MAAEVENLDFEGDEPPAPTVSNASAAGVVPAPAAAAATATAAATGSPNGVTAVQPEVVVVANGSAPPATGSSHQVLVRGLDHEEDEDIWKGKVSGYADVQAAEVSLSNFPEKAEDKDRDCVLTFPTAAAAAKCKAALLDKGLVARLAGEEAPAASGAGPQGGASGGVVIQKRSFLDEPLDNLVNESKRRRLDHEQNGGVEQAANGNHGWGKYQGGAAPYAGKQGGTNYGKPMANGGKGWGWKGKEPQYIDPTLPSWLATRGYGTQIDLNKGRKASDRKGIGKGDKNLLGKPVDNSKNGQVAFLPPAANNTGSGFYALPSEPASKWSPDMQLEKQLVDYLNMKRHGNLNRYLVLSGLQDRMMNCKSIRGEFDWMLLDGSSAVLSIELHTMMGKDVAHLALRDVKSASALKKYIEDNPERYTNTRVAHAAPRKAGHTLWIGGLPADFSVTPWFLAPLKKLFEKFGKLQPQPGKEYKAPWWEQLDAAEKKEREARFAAAHPDAANGDAPAAAPAAVPEKNGDDVVPAEAGAAAAKAEPAPAPAADADKSNKPGDAEKKPEDGGAGAPAAATSKGDEAEKKPAATDGKEGAEEKPLQNQNGDGAAAPKDATAEAAADAPKPETAADATAASSEAAAAATPGDAAAAAPGEGAKEAEDEPVYLAYVPKKHCAFVTYELVQDAITARNHLYALPLPTASGTTFLNLDFIEEDDDDEDEAASAMLGQLPLSAYHSGASSVAGESGVYSTAQGTTGNASAARRTVSNDNASVSIKPRRSRTPKRHKERAEKKEKKQKEGKRDAKASSSAAAQVAKSNDKKAESVATDKKSTSDKAGDKEKANKNYLSLYKMGDFCCKVKATHVHGSPANAAGEILAFESKKLEIDQRTKLEHLITHHGRTAKTKFSIYNLTPRERGDIPNFNELVTYFSDRKRVGLVSMEKHSIYLVPGKKELFLDDIPWLEESARGADVQDGFIAIVLPVVPKNKSDKPSGDQKAGDKKKDSAAAGGAAAEEKGSSAAAGPALAAPAAEK